jgi:hypothetical protein
MLALTYSRLEKEKKNPPVVETRGILVRLSSYRDLILQDISHNFQGFILLVK